MYRITLGLILYFAVSAYAAFENCGSTVGHYNDVIVSNWNPYENVYSLVRGQRFPITINFDLYQDTQTVSAIPHIIMEGTSYSFPIAHFDGCHEAGLSCPLTKRGGPHKYKPNLIVPEIFEKTDNFTLKWELKNQNGDNIVCVLIPSKIV